ncbi:MAG: FeoB-associated Cys-rich membrane protein [Eubacteriales bacterium]|nr:FeoB-associated Cys-rich membrane protein [Eubacteriales bacterium]
MRLADYLLLALLAFGVFLVIRRMVKRKKEGSFCGCGGNCAECGGCGHAQSVKTPPVRNK